MRFGVCVPQSGRFLAADAQLRMARELEAMGYDSIWTSDHVIVPVGEGYIPELMHEPLALLAWLAAQTERVSIGVSVLVLPYRDPVFTAKFLSSLDVLAGGRLVLGVGAGWLRQEFDALSADYERRGAQTDEYLRVLRNLWETETSSFHGEWKHYDDMRMFPKAAREREGRTIPIIVGGNAPASVRRAAELGDGWHPIRMTPDELAPAVAAYQQRCADFGRTPGEVTLRLMGEMPAAADVAAYGDAGLDELLLSIPAGTVDDLLDQARSFLDAVR